MVWVLLHGERLSGAGLAVGQDRRVVTVEDALRVKRDVGALFLVNTNLMREILNLDSVTLNTGAYSNNVKISRRQEVFYAPIAPNHDS